MKYLYEQIELNNNVFYQAKVPGLLHRQIIDEHAVSVAKVLNVSLDDLAGFDAKAVGVPMPPRGKHLFGTVTLGERGQLVIPKAAREVFDLHAGDTLVVLGDEEQGIAITKAEAFMAGVNELIGKLGISE